MTPSIQFGHPLYGAELRLARAGRLIGTMQRQYRAWADEHEETGFNYERDPITRGKLNMRPNIPDSRHVYVPRISITLGETAYNIRAALDYLVYSIARANNEGIEVDGTQFPLSTSSDGYWMRWTGKNAKGRDVAKWLDKVPKEIADDLAHYQPFAGCGWTKILLGISNRDKHRHLTTLTTSARANPDEISSVINPDENTQTIHFRGNVEVGVFLPTGEDVLDASNLVQREARALIRSYAGRFKIPPPGLV